MVNPDGGPPGASAQRDGVSAPFDSGNLIINRAKPFLWILIISLLLSAPFVIFAIRDIARAKTLDLRKSDITPPTFVGLPSWHHAPDLLTIVVLDISASMKTNDKGFDQIRALETFLRIYQHMSAGVSTGSSKANVGIVLYGSNGKAISFDGNEFLGLGKPGDVDKILRTVSPFLGSLASGEDDPRNGWNTDHLAAAKKAGELVSSYIGSAGHKGPICVLFMTDGIHDPSPLLDANLAGDQLGRNRTAFADAFLQAARSRGQLAIAEKAWNDFLESASSTGPITSKSPARALFPVYELWQAGKDRVFGGDSSWFRNLVSGLPVGSAVGSRALASACGMRPGDLFRMVRLGSNKEDVPTGTEVISVRNASGLGVSFATVLARWMQLRKCPVTDEYQFPVEPGAQSLAIVIRSENQQARGVVRCGKDSHPIENGLCLASNPSPGTWKIDLGRDPIKSVEAYADQRYQWAFELPTSYSYLEQPPEARFALFRADTRERTDPKELFRKWPRDLRADFSGKGVGTISVPFRFSGDENSYVGTLPQPENLGAGPIKLSATLGDLEYTNGQQARPVTCSGVTSYGKNLSIQMVDRSRGHEDAVIGGLEVKMVRGSSFASPNRPSGDRTP